MIKFTPAVQSSVLVHDVQVFVPSNTDWVTLDKDGELKAWYDCRKPLLNSKGYYDKNQLDRDAYGIRLGEFERDDGKLFEPLIIEV